MAGLDDFLGAAGQAAAQGQGQGPPQQPQQPPAPPPGSQAANPQPEGSGVTVGPDGRLRITIHPKQPIQTPIEPNEGAFREGAQEPVGPGTAIPDDAPITSPDSPVESALGGAVQSVLQTKDTITGLLGGDTSGPKSAFRQAIEARADELNSESGLNSLAYGVAQFGTAFVGLGKVLKPIAYGTGLVKSAIAGDTALGAATSGIAFDPHAHALDDFLKSYPALQPVIGQYLAADPKDETAAEGRMRNGVENLVLGGLLGKSLEVGATGVAKAYTGVLTAAAKAVKFGRAGNLKAANEAAEQVSAQLAKAAKQREVPYAQQANSGEGGAPAGAPGGGPGGGPAAGRGGVLGDAPSAVPGEPPGEGLPAAAGITGEGAPGAGPVPPSGDEALGLSKAPAGPGAKPLPKVKADFEPEEVEKLIKAAKKDTGAILDAGSYDEALQEGYAFATPNNLIPYAKLASGNEQVDAWLARMVENQAAYIQKVRGGNAEGVMTDAMVNRMIASMSKVWELDPALIHGALMQAGKDAKLLAAKMDLAFLLATKATQDSYGMVMRINAQNYGEAATREVAVAQAKQQMAVALEMVAAGKSMVSNMARGLRRAGAYHSSIKLSDIAGMKVNLASMKDQDFLDSVSASKGNLAALSDKVTPNSWARVLGFSTMVAAASKVWGWSTLVAITVSNTSQLYLRPLAAFAGAHFQVGKAAMAGDDALRATAAGMRKQARREFILQHSMAEDWWQAAKDAFIKGDSRLTPHSNAAPVNSELQAGGTSNTRMGRTDLGVYAANWRPISNVEDIGHNILESAKVLANDPMDSMANVAALPFRVHGSLQEAFQTIRYRAIVMAKAMGEAEEQGLAPPKGPWDITGGKKYLDFVQKRVRQSFGPDGEARDLAAQAEAQDSTFASRLLQKGTDQTWGGMTSMGAAVQHFASDWQAARFFIPFTQFPVNAFRRGVQLTPGLNLLQKQYLNDIQGVNGAYSQARAMGEMGLGLFIGMKAVQMRIDGRITGAGPKNPRENSSMRSQGIEPHSIVMGNGTPEHPTKYFQISRLEPYQAPLSWWSTYADIIASGHAGEWTPPQSAAGQVMSAGEQAFTAALMATLYSIKDKTSLTNISQLLDAVQSDDKLEALAGRNIPGMLTPMVSALKMVNPDPFLREINGLFDGFAANIPGLSDKLPPRLDWKGDPEHVPGKFVNDAGMDGPVDAALRENYSATGHYPTPPVPRTQDGVDLRDVTTEKGESAYHRFQVLAGHPDLWKKPEGTLADPKKSLYAQIEKLVSSDEYQGLVHGKSSEQGTKEAAIEKLLVGYHKAGLAMLRDESPVVNQALSQRAQDLGSQLQTRQKDLRAAHAEGAAKAINSLLGPYGLSLPVPNGPLPPSAGPQQ